MEETLKGGRVAFWPLWGKIELITIATKDLLTVIPRRGHSKGKYAMKKYGTMLVCLAFALISPADGAFLSSKPSQPASANPVIIDYGIAENENIVEAVKQLAESSSIPINIEIIRKYGQPLSLILPSFSVKTGNYRVGEVLQKLEAASSQIHHIRSAGCINIQITLSKDIDNPFDHLVSSDLDSRMSADDLISHLNQTDASYGLDYEPLAINTQIAGRSYLLGHQPTPLSLRKGQTLRMAFNAIGLNQYTRWFAIVNDKNPQSLSERKDGKMVLLYSDPNNLSGRTLIAYYGIFQ